MRSAGSAGGSRSTSPTPCFRSADELALGMLTHRLLFLAFLQKMPYLLSAFNCFCPAAWCRMTVGNTLKDFSCRSNFQGQVPKRIQQRGTTHALPSMKWNACSTWGDRKSVV